MKKALIIGANGYLGRNLTKLLIERGWDITPADIQEKSIDGYKNYLRLNVNDKATLSQINTETDYLFMFAGLTGTSVGFEQYEDFIHINELGLLNVLNKIRENGHPCHIVFPSTRLVYKGQTGIPLSEESEKEFKTIYAINKYACEQILAMYQHNFGITYTIFRICVPYGNMIDHNYSFGTIGFMLGKAQKRENIHLFGNGSQRRTFTHIEDLCRQISMTLQHTESINTVFNIGGHQYSLSEVAQTFAKKFDISVIYEQWPEKDLKIESGDTIFNASKLENLVSYTYKHDLKYWIEQLT